MLFSSLFIAEDLFDLLFQQLYVDFGNIENPVVPASPYLKRKILKEFELNNGNRFKYE